MNAQELKTQIQKLVTAQVTRHTKDQETVLAGLRQQLDTIERNDAAAGVTRGAAVVKSEEDVDIRKAGSTRPATGAEILAAVKAVLANPSTTSNEILALAKAAASNPSMTSNERDRLATMVLRHHYRTQNRIA